jgi:hypothetical protein
MSHDFLKKEPTKTEKMMYEIVMQQQQMERGLWTTSAHVCALALVLGASPEKVAEFMTLKEDQIKDYSQKINEAIAKIEKERHDKEHAGHEHGDEHEHNDNNNDNDNPDETPEVKAE